MFRRNQCVQAKSTSSAFSRLNHTSAAWAASALSSFYCAQVRGTRFLRGTLCLAGLSLLSGCTVDMSRFAGAVGGATAEFTCAIVQLLFACEL